MPWADLLGRYRIICIIAGVRGFFSCLFFQSRGARFMHRLFNSVCFGDIWSACRRTAGNHFLSSCLPSSGLFSKQPFQQRLFQQQRPFPTEAFPAAVLSTAAFPGTLPDNLMEAFCAGRPYHFIQKPAGQDDG